MIRDRFRFASGMALVCAMALVPSVTRADDGGATDASATAPTAATAETDAAAASPHPPGVAERPIEAPGSARLAGPTGEPLQHVAPGTVDPAAERSMAFGANGGECRDTIPGGPVLAAAYAVVLLLLGLYAFVIGRKNAKLSEQLDELERIIAKKSEAKG